jgi:hypothetical protein
MFPKVMASFMCAPRGYGKFYVCPKGLWQVLYVPQEVMASFMCAPRGYGKFYVCPKRYVRYLFYKQPNTGRQVPGIVVTNLFC